MALRKAIATPPGEKTLYVDLTPEEEAARQAEVDAVLNAPPPPPTPEDEMHAAIAAATTVEELKSALLGLSSAGKAAGVPA